MTGNEYAVVVSMVSACWPSAAWPRATIAAGQRQLLDLDFETTKAAIDDLAGREFAPNAGQIRKRALELGGASVIPAADALAEMFEQIRRTGYIGTPVWSSPAIGATVDALGGWGAVCASENVEALRAHFLRVYEPMADRAQHIEIMPPSVKELLNGLDLRASRALGPA
jgi:hypothetical protein